jgi:hypothetical protein
VTNTKAVAMTGKVSSNFEEHCMPKRDVWVSFCVAGFLFMKEDVYDSDMRDSIREL